jgi:DNA polymerase III epsilon subunit-like protein
MGKGSLMNLFSTRSFLVALPQSNIAAHRAPCPLSSEALQLWLKGLSASGTTLTWKETGFRLSWSQPHNPTLEASQIDCVRSNFKAMATLMRVKRLPEIIPERSSPEEDTRCYHAWNITKEPDQEEPKQSGLFQEALNLDDLPLCFGEPVTTGFTDKDRVVQLALVRVSSNGKATSYTSYFNPDGRRNHNWSINRISDWKLKTAPYLRNLIPLWLPLLDGAVFITHNADFDERMLTQELTRYHQTWPAAHAIDTHKLAKIIWPKAPSHKLEILALWLGIHQGKVYDAMGDTQTLMALWKALCAERPTFTISHWARMAI